MVAVVLWCPALVLCWCALEFVWCFFGNGKYRKGLCLRTEREAVKFQHVKPRLQRGMGTRISGTLVREPRYASAI